MADNPRCDKPLFTVYLVWLTGDGQRYLHNLYADEALANAESQTLDAAGNSSFVQVVPVVK